MIKRTIYIGNPAYLKLKLNQMVVQEPESADIKGSVPIEDLAVLVLDHPQITLSQHLIQKLMEHTVCLIACDERHMPNGVMLPLNGHSELTERWKYQIDASLPLKKQLWKQTVVSKIQNQRALLKSYNLPHDSMDMYEKNVITGDEYNMEGKAAVHYWKYLFQNFSRHRHGDAPNNFLNFGYAILRSIVARALVSSGMLPAIGIFHRNKYNAYCLADDIMEPYRPFVDKLVTEWVDRNPDSENLTKEAKAHLLNVATHDVWIEQVKRPLLVAVTTTTASLQKCFMGERRTIIYPKLYESG